MTADDVVNKLREGWELANRGTGWWISAPKIPYKATPVMRVEDHIVEGLQSDGKIKVEIPYCAAKATLIQ